MKKFTLLMGAALMALTASATDYYLIGGFNKWGLAQENCKFTEGENGVYTLNYQGVLTSGFKINDGTWDNHDTANWGANTDNNTLTVGTTYELVLGSDENINISEEVQNPTLEFNPTANTLLVKGQAAQLDYTYTVNLAGAFNSYNGSDSKTLFTQSETNANEFTFTYNGELNSVFAIVVHASASGVSSEKWFSTRDKVESGKSYTLSEISYNNCNFAVTPAKNPVFTYNVKTNELVVTYSAGEEQEVKYGYMIHASWVPGSEAWNREALTKGEDGVWSITQTVPANGEFGVKVVKDDAVDESSWITTLSKDSENCSGGNGSNIKITKAGTYVISFVPNATNGDEGVVTVKEQTSTRVATIEAANTEAVYFNMQGVRVANPENGIFIRVQNGKAVKVVK